MPLTALMSVGSSVAGVASAINTALSPLNVITNIISKMSVSKSSILRRLFGRRSRLLFVFMPKYKQFVQSITKEKLSEKYLFIDFEDYVKTILNEQEVAQFNNFINDKSDNDLYKEIVSEMVNKLFSNDINTSKRIIYLTDNEKVFKLIDQKRKIYIYPKLPDDSEMKSMYCSMIEHIKSRLIIYKSFSELEDIILNL